MQALGLIETKGLVALIEAGDAALKSANVQLVGWNKVGSGYVTIMVTGDVAAVKAAVDAGSAAASKVGEVLSVQVIPRPHSDLSKVLRAGCGRRQQRRRLNPPCNKQTLKGTTLMASNGEAVGLLETRAGRHIVATDAMCKAAEVEVIKPVQIGGAYVTTMIRGDVGSVRAAVDAGCGRQQDRRTHHRPHHPSPRACDHRPVRQVGWVVDPRRQDA